jgi:hypothetical protein
MCLHPSSSRCFRKDSQEQQSDKLKKEPKKAFRPRAKGFFVMCSAMRNVMCGFAA